MAGLRWSAARSMAIGWGLAAVLGLALWRMETVWFAAAAVYGALQALEIVIIVFGAILLMNHLNASGAIATIRWHITQVVDDHRIQALLIGMGFMMVIEGVAGFGTPGALAAPLFIGLGFPPLAAAALALVFNGSQPPFGAAGTPVIGGVGSVIDEEVLAGEIPVGTFLDGVSGWTGVVTGVTWVFWGLFVVFLMLLWAGHTGERTLRGAMRAALPVAPFALLLGLLAGGTQFVTGWFLGPELPDIAAGFVVLGLGAVLARRNILMPAERWRFETSGNWPAGWLGGLERSALPVEAPRRVMPVLLAWTPYLLVALVLLVTRWPGLGIVDELQRFTVGVESIFGQDLSFSLRYLYLPGVVPFMPVVLLTGLIHRMKLTDVGDAWKRSARQVAIPTVTLVLAVSMAQVMIQSATNQQAVPGMMEALSRVLAAGAGGVLPFVAPWIGALGAFVTGSNTSSNILFSVLQFDAAGETGVPRTIVVALQNVGGGIGNMVSVLNISALSAVIGMTGQEGEILRKALVATVASAMFAGALGLLLTLLFPTVY
jgi:lactate permease